MNQEEILGLLTEKFPQVSPAHLTPLATSLASQNPDSHQGQALVAKLTLEQIKDFVPQEALNTEAFAHLASAVLTPSLEQLIQERIAREVETLEQRLSKFETTQRQQQRYSQLQEVLSGCEDQGFRQQSLRDFKRMQFASADDFAQYLQQKQQDVQQTNQLLANRNLSLQHPPYYAKDPQQTGVSSSVATFIQLQQGESIAFKGKEV